MTNILHMSRRVESRDFVVIPELKFSEYTGGIQTRDILERLQILTELLNEQANLLDDYREYCISRLSSELADQNDDPSGEEYQQSLDLQGEAFRYHELVRFMVSDRNELILGTQNALTTDDIKRVLSLPDDGTNSILSDGLKARESVKPRKGLGSLNHMRADLRAKIRSLEDSVQTARKRGAITVELDIASRVLSRVEQEYAKQKTICEELNKELEFLSNVYNARLEYYRQFQLISDSVQEFTVVKQKKHSVMSIAEQLDHQLNSALGNHKKLESLEDDISDKERSARIAATLKQLDKQKDSLAKAIEQGVTRTRYLAYLGSKKTEESDLCTICTGKIEIGAFTMCGHIFCRDCFQASFFPRRGW